MHSVCLLFAGRRGLDDQGTRHSVLRIPEVSRKLKQAQYLLDQIIKSDDHIDLYSFILASDSDFNLQQDLKSLVSSIVQMGLFDRYVKFRNRPQFLIGRSNGNGSAMTVCADKQSFEDFVLQSEYCLKKQSIPTLHQMETQQLAGMCLEEYGLYKWDQQLGEYQTIEVESKEAAKIVDQLSLDNLINQCIHIGPHHEFRNKEFENFGINNVPSMNSIDLDPILNSFWRSA